MPVNTKYIPGVARDSLTGEIVALLNDAEKRIVTLEQKAGITPGAMEIAAPSPDEIKAARLKAAQEELAAAQKKLAEATA